MKKSEMGSKEAIENDVKEIDKFTTAYYYQPR
jgi:hypothetical protein